MSATIGLKLKELRKSLNRNQEEVARAIGISRARYSHYENDRVEPDIELIKKIATYYDVTTDYLLGIEPYVPEDNPDKNEVKLTPYQQEVLDFFNSREDLFFHDHPGDIRQALEQFEIYYEVWKRQQEKKKN